MLESVLIANRGEIAVRIASTVRALGARVVSVYSDADASLPYVREADEAVYIGEPAPAQSYLDSVLLIDVARKAGAAAVHPGYGFLAESAGFAQAVINAGLTWVGPPPDELAPFECRDDQVHRLRGDERPPCELRAREAVALAQQTECHVLGR